MVQPFKLAKHEDILSCWNYLYDTNSFVFGVAEFETSVSIRFWNYIDNKHKTCLLSLWIEMYRFSKDEIWNVKLILQMFTLLEYQKILKEKNLDGLPSTSSKYIYFLYFPGHLDLRSGRRNIYTTNNCINNHKSSDCI